MWVAGISLRPPGPMEQSRILPSPFLLLWGLSGPLCERRAPLTPRHSFTHHPLINSSLAPGGCCHGWDTLGLSADSKYCPSSHHWAFSCHSLPLPTWHAPSLIYSTKRGQTELGHSSILLSTDGPILHSDSQARLSGPPGRSPPFSKFPKLHQTLALPAPSYLPESSSPGQPCTRIPNSLMGSSQTQAPKDSLIHFFHSGHLSTALEQTGAAVQACVSLCLPPCLPAAVPTPLVLPRRCSPTILVLLANIHLCSLLILSSLQP